MPASVDSAAAVRLGLGLVPDLQGDAGFVELGDPVDVALHWQRWRSRTASPDRVADAVRAAARRALRPERWPVPNTSAKSGAGSGVER